MSYSRKLNDHLQKLVDAGDEIGVQLSAYHEGRLVIDSWAGLADETTGRPVTGDTLFNVFSVTKAVSATVLHVQAEGGALRYDDKVASIWPEFAAHGKQEVTIADVLQHRSGVPQMPPEVTPETMCDWDWMTDRIAALEPVVKPGVESGYQSMTFGWIVGEIARRIDGGRRGFGAIVKDLIADPLGIADLWVGLPHSEHGRVAIMNGDSVFDFPDGTLYRAACPRQVDLMPEPFGRPGVREACIPAVGGIFTARAGARFFAMLANGGELDGVRLLSEERVHSFIQPRPRADEPDPVFFGMVVPMGSGGYWLGSDKPPTAAPANPRALCHPGMGGAIGFADLDRKLAVMFCRNRLYNPTGPEDDRGAGIANHIRDLLSL